MARTPPLVTLPGEEDYGKYLDHLIEEAQKRGHAVTTRTGIVELCLNMVGSEWGLKPPRRAKPFGSNQHPSKSSSTTKSIPPIDTEEN